MANRKLTDPTIPTLTSIADGDIEYIIDVSDTTDSPEGTSKKTTYTTKKNFFKTYFDTLYTTTSAVASQITTALSGYLTSATAASTYEPLKGSDDNYVTDAEKTVLSNTSGTNTGDQDLSGLQPKGQPVTETGTSFSLTDAHNGKITILTASCTVTIPNGLVAGFEHTIVTLAGVTLTVALGGSVTLFNNAGTTMAEKLSCTIKNRAAANQYITAGNL